MTAIMAIGSAVAGAISSIQAGNAQADADRRNQAVARINAGTQLATSEADTARIQRLNQHRIATAENTAAGSGFQISSGSNMDIMADLAAEGSLDAEITRWKGRVAANSYLQQGENDAIAADQAERAGWIGAGTTLLNAGARYYGATKAKMPTNPFGPE